MLKALLIKTLCPTPLPNLFAHVVLFAPRFVCGYLLAVDFGASKFGMPWTDPERGLGLFQVAEWFPEDVASYGPPFSLAPTFFAWMGAASEAIGGVFLALGLGTRIAAFFLMCTMLVAIFCEKWGSASWEMLPAMGFLWVSLFHLALGSGALGIDRLLTWKGQPAE